MEKYNKLLRNITELIEKGLFTSKDLKKYVEDSIKLKIEMVASKLNLVSREEFEVQKKIIEKLRKTLNKLNNKKKVSKDIAYQKHRYFISKSAITLIDYLQKTLDVEVNIFFLMNGIRDSERDIGIKKFFKKVDLDELKFTVDSFINFFQSFKKN